MPNLQAADNLSHSKPLYLMLASAVLIWSVWLKLEVLNQQHRAVTCRGLSQPVITKGDLNPGSAAPRALLIQMERSILLAVPRR